MVSLAPRIALSFLYESNVRPCHSILRLSTGSIPKIYNLAKELGAQGCHTLKDMTLTPIRSV